jgi:hypothetical protein
MNSVEIVGTVRGLGQYYREGLERLEIWIDKKRGKGLPNKDGKRVPIILVIGAHQFFAGIRSTNSNPYIWVCPDLKLKDENNKKVSLASALRISGFKKNQKVIFKIIEPMKMNKYRLEILKE